MRAMRAVGLTGGLLASLAWSAPASAEPAFPGDVQIIVDATHAVNRFTPDDAIGVALDGMQKGEVDANFTPENMAKIRAVGLKHVTYRTRAELGIEVWHWSDQGTWSDAAHEQGYWTGSDHPTTHPKVTWGYSLPRRGDTVDNANNVGYSRIDDGDPTSFWKSNPYLDRRYTGLTESRPEWVIFSFHAPVNVDAIKIAWGTPYATRFLVQYWSGKDGYQQGKETAEGAGDWVTFAHGDQTEAGPPKDAVIRLADAPRSLHFVRILLLRSSETAPPGATDIRDRLGYAIREAGLGVIGPGGRFVDAMRHGKSQTTQSVVQVSSTDPWHRAVDRDKDTEQPGLDFVFANNLNFGAPLMVPVGTYYDTPENAAAEIRFIENRGFPVTQVELGDEADGQFIRPEDYADLYLEFAKAIRAVDPHLQLGGPSMQNAHTGTWPDTNNGTSWPGRFVAELKVRGGLDQLQFFSFEHYVFDDVCDPLGGMLRDETSILQKILDDTAANGMPRTIPWVISEYGFSPFSGRAMSEMPSALLSGDIVGHFLTYGGAQAYILGYTPDTPANQDFACAGYGNMMLYEADDDGRAKWPMPEMYAVEMMLRDWGAPEARPHDLFTATESVKDAGGRPVVVAYPVRRPDGGWNVMLINRDSARAHIAHVILRAEEGDAPLGAGKRLNVVQYSPAQYAWLDKGENSHPTKDLPPARFSQPGGQAIALPAFSLTVVSEAP